MDDAELERHMALVAHADVDDNDDEIVGGDGNVDTLLQDINKTCLSYFSPASN